MKILKVKQGSDEWKAIRASTRNASEAPVMKGVSNYKSRQELIREKATGIEPEIDAATQRRFDKGHETEAAARLLLEEDMGISLYPIVATDDAGYLLASSDGSTLPPKGGTGYEHKLWNEKLAESVRNGVVPESHAWQLDQQIAVFGFEKIIFVVSDGTRENRETCEYRTTPERIEQLLSGWKQFDEDVANYQHVETAPIVAAAPTLDLPVVSIKTSGQISIISNLKRFGEALNAFIERLPTKPSTDQEFADCKAALTKLKTAEETLDSEEAKALSQMEEIDEMRREKKLYQDLARTTRLALEKLVVAREAAIKSEIMQEGRDQFAEHITTLNKRLGRVHMPAVPADFVSAIKNKRTVESLRNAVNTTLANAKIAANEIADKIQINLATLDEQKEFSFLFNDVSTLAMKANDDLKNIIKLRISEHQAEQARKLEAEREKIRKEEQQKAEREAAERQRKQQEAENQAAAPTVAEVAQEVIPSPSVASPTVAQSAVIHTTAKPTMTPANMPDYAKDIIGLIAGMDESELKLVAHYCERIIKQRPVQVAA